VRTLGSSCSLSVAAMAPTQKCLLLVAAVGPMLLLLQGCGSEEECIPSEGMGSPYTDENCKSPDPWGNTDCSTCSKIFECFECAQNYTAVPAQSEYVCDACGVLRFYTCKEHNITKTDDTKCTNWGGEYCFVVPGEEMTCKDGYTPQLIDDDFSKCPNDDVPMVKQYVCVEPSGFVV